MKHVLQYYSLTDLTIPEAVNMIMVVPDDQLLELGRKLELDDVACHRISVYDPKERHQRLIESWFEMEDKPSREMLMEVLPRRESSASMSSILPSQTSGHVNHRGKCHRISFPRVS